MKLRNGIHSHEILERKDFESLEERSCQNEDGSLPTLKVVNMFGETDLRTNSAVHSRSLQSMRYHHRSASLPSLSPDPSQPLSSSCTPTVHVPRPSPVSPTMLTDYQKRMLWKKKVQTPPGSASANYEKRHASVVGVHELYENDELLQDWKDVYITSAYLIWCQTNRRKKRKAKSTGSIRKEPRRVTFKDVTEDMIPATMERIKPKRPEPRRSPTVGLPYSPSRASSYRQVHVQHLDLASCGLEDYGDFPKSVIAGILQHLKPSKVAVENELPLGLEAHPKQQSSPRAGESEATSGRTGQKKQLKPTDVPEKSLQQTIHDENSRMLLDIDINSHFTRVEEQVGDEDGGVESLGTLKQGTKPEPNIVKAASEKLAARQGRVFLPLPSVGVPTQRGAKVKAHHCVNSIPRNLDLSVVMEPVDVVSVTPSPTGTPAEEVTAQGSQLCVQDQSPLDVTLAASELASPNDDQMNWYWPTRGHITSALRYSPTPVRAPAPTPISPEKYGQYSRTPHRRTSITSRHMSRWETLTSVHDEDEPAPTREALGSPEGEGDEVALEPVFLTEDVLTRDRSLTPLLNRKDIGEWPQQKMIVNIIENGDEMPRSVRSPSPGSKTYIPQDILAEFHGDLYGRHPMHIAGQKVLGKPNIVQESLKTADIPSYIAPAWRPPRSRTPIQFLETPSRSAPKPLRQPPAESVPRSLNVQALAKRPLQRPKSTPSRITSPRDSCDLPVQQILSDSSLVHSTRDDMETYSMAVQASSPSVDGCGSIPPPPSPEAVMVTGLVPSAPRLDPVSEAEEKSSLASASVADGISQVEGSDNTVANPFEVEEENKGDELDQKLENGSSENKNEEEAVETTEDVEKSVTERNKNVSELANVYSQSLDEVKDSLSVKDNYASSTDSVINEMLHDQTEAPTIEAGGVGHCETLDNGENEFDEKQDEIQNDASLNVLVDKSEQHEEVIVPPHPPGSPDIINTPDFTEGLDMNLDLEAELRAAMEGLDDLDDNEANENRASPDLEAW